MFHCSMGHTHTNKKKKKKKRKRKNPIANTWSVNNVASTLIIKSFWIFILYATIGGWGWGQKEDSYHKRKRTFRTEITSSIIIFRCHLSIQSAKHWGCVIWNVVQYAKHPYRAANVTKDPDESCAFLKRLLGCRQDSRKQIFWADFFILRYTVRISTIDSHN